MGGVDSSRRAGKENVSEYQFENKVWPCGMVVTTVTEKPAPSVVTLVTEKPDEDALAELQIAYMVSSPHDYGDEEQCRALVEKHGWERVNEGCIKVEMDKAE